MKMQMFSMKMNALIRSSAPSDGKKLSAKISSEKISYVSFICLIHEYDTVVRMHSTGTTMKNTLNVRCPARNMIRDMDNSSIAIHRNIELSKRGLFADSSYVILKSGDPLMMTGVPSLKLNG